MEQRHHRRPKPDGLSRHSHGGCRDEPRSGVGAPETESLQDARYEAHGDTPQHRATSRRRKRRKAQRAKQVLSGLVFYLAIAAMLGGAILFARSTNEKKSLFGYRIYNVLTHSMESKAGAEVVGQTKGFPAGSAILVRIVDPDQVRIGDIVTYVPGEDETSYLTHRVVDIQSTLNGESGPFFVTRGDANNTNDPPFHADRLIGVVRYSVPKLGFAVDYIQKHLPMVIVLLVSVFCFIFALNMLAESKKKGGRRRRHSKARHTERHKQEDPYAVQEYGDGSQFCT